MYCILLTTLENRYEIHCFSLILKEISSSVFSWKKRLYKKLRCNSTVKIRFGQKKILSYAYVLKNVFVLPRFDLCHVLSSSTNNFARAQLLSRMSSLSDCMNIAQVNIGFFTGFKKIKQRRISFVLGYLRMIIWKISTAISIKHWILATFNI